MRRLYAKVSAALLISVVLLLSGCEQPTQTQQQDSQTAPQEIAARHGDPVEGQYIVKLKSNLTDGTMAERAEQADRQIDAVLQEFAIASDDMLGRYRYALQGFAARLSDAQLNRLMKDSRIDYIEKDRVVILAPPCGTPPCGGGGDDDDGGGNTGQVTPWGITRVGGATASSGTAWVIDTGVDLDHPDLNVDVSRSATMIDRGKDSKDADDNNGHGTHVAGTIAAIDNDADVVGVAAGATVVAVKVLDRRGSGYYSDVIEGVDYVAANASSGDAANMSLGGPTSDALDDAIRAAADNGIRFALAAGNDGDDANNYSPARVEYNNVWTVSAFDDTDAFASFSNWSGPTDPPIEFGAPGVDILSLWKDGGTNTISGTSMASPHVAGLLLLGNPATDGTVTGDPDGDPDPIAHN